MDSFLSKLLDIDIISSQFSGILNTHKYIISMGEPPKWLMKSFIRADDDRDNKLYVVYVHVVAGIIYKSQFPATSDNNLDMYIVNNQVLSIIEIK